MQLLWPEFSLIPIIGPRSDPGRNHRLERGRRVRIPLKCEGIEAGRIQGTDRPRGPRTLCRLSPSQSHSALFIDLDLVSVSRAGGDGGAVAVVLEVAQAGAGWRCPAAWGAALRGAVALVGRRWLRRCLRGVLRQPPARLVRGCTGV